jgi:CheY-like chemotaxis protein
MADGLSVFLVEDEALIRMMITDMVEELGHHVIAEADNIQDASAFAMTAQYDLAILDINLMGV